MDAPARHKRSAPGHRWVVALVAIMTIMGATAGYLTAGAVLAVVQGAVFLALGVLGLRLAPNPQPPSSSSIPRPAVGSSPDAVRRRLGERIALLAIALPLTAAAVLIALLADDPTVRAVAGAVAVLCVVAFGAAGLVATAPGPFWDRLRTRLYERSVARADEYRSHWERHVDPAAEQAKERRLVGLILFGLFFPLGLGLALLPAVLAAATEIPVLAALGALVSLALLAALLRWTWRSLRGGG